MELNGFVSVELDYRGSHFKWVKECYDIVTLTFEATGIHLGILFRDILYNIRIYLYIYFYSIWSLFDIKYAYSVIKKYIFIKVDSMRKYQFDGQRQM